MHAPTASSRGSGCATPRSAKKAGAARIPRVLGLPPPSDDLVQRKWAKTFAYESTVRFVRVATQAHQTSGDDALVLAESDFARDGTSAKLARFLGVARPREAYATLVYGDGPFARGRARASSGT